MDVREKLVELIFKSLCRHIHKSCKLAENIADDLIADGVTVQDVNDINVGNKWIPAKDRLPEKPMKCLVYTKRGEYGGYEITYYNEGFYLQYANVTHWMPLPDEPEVKND